MTGLKRLEYRGYDSAGLACDGQDGKTVTIKRSGKVNNLVEVGFPARRFGLLAQAGSSVFGRKYVLP